MPRWFSAAYKALFAVMLAGAAVAQPSQQFEPVRPSGYNSDGQRTADGSAPSVKEDTVILNQGSYNPEEFYIQPANPNAAPKKIANHHVAPPPADPGSVTSRTIYRCKDSSNTSVYADDDNHHKFHSCVKIREEKLPAAAMPVAVAGDPGMAAAPRAREEALPTCSGALLYKGSTYVFSDLETCPIPEEVFKARRPIEASGDYYAPPVQPKP